mmetsp:Transcript_11018/g.21598  ORF Transcript_11018/g.21598 Transcript_11018/m.21598 type:complete len:100 (+) Transcript_11018:2530-2829(+)
MIGAIVCKADQHKLKRGYIAMLDVKQAYRGRGIGKELVKRAIEKMKEEDVEEVVLETEVTNTAALRLYQSLGFAKDKRLQAYYLNGVDAFRLKLWFKQI